jgi:hypothetical protein
MALKLQKITTVPFAAYSNPDKDFPSTLAFNSALNFS